MILLFLGVGFSDGREVGFDMLKEMLLIPVSAANDHANRVIEEETYRVVALP